MATEVDFSGKVKRVVVDENTLIEADSVILATGATAKYLGLESEEKFKGYGVSACATCDGFFYKGQEVAIVGGGDTAAEEASYLANICKKVTMLVRKDHMRASKAMQHRVNNTDNLDGNADNADTSGDITGNNNDNFDDDLTSANGASQISPFDMAQSWQTSVHCSTTANNQSVSNDPCGDSPTHAQRRVWAQNQCDLIKIKTSVSNNPLRLNPSKKPPPEVAVTPVLDAFELFPILKSGISIETPNPPLELLS